MTSEVLQKALRTGFTTGACAAAAATAAWLRLAHGRSVSPLSLIFPDGCARDLPVAGTAYGEGMGAEAWVVKDAGDDVDITDRAVIHARVAPSARREAQQEDFVEACGKATVILRGGRGVGLVTRRGLEVPPGKWAINPVPRRMILENLERVGLGASAGSWRVEIRVENGAELALRTLNPVLGIERGISILGTTGIVIPFSNAAYEATIRVLLKGAAECGCPAAVLVTGGRTQKAAQAALPELPDFAFVQVGDFIERAVAYCREFGHRRVVVACMQGKLAKYALGLEYTHAHTAALSLETVANLLGSLGVAGDRVEACRACRSMREFFEGVPIDEAVTITGALAEKALEVFRSWAAECDFELLVFGSDLKPLGWWGRRA